jgi:hypothetical protein
MENRKAYKDIFEFPVLKLSDEGRLVSGQRNGDTFVDVTEGIIGKTIISIGLKSQYLYIEGDAFKASPIKQIFTTEEKAKYKSLGGKNRRYRMIYVPETKATYIMTYTNGVGESFYAAGVGISDAFKIVGIEKRPTMKGKSSKVGVKFYAPVLEKLNLKEVALDQEDKATIARLKEYFEPYKPVTEVATTATVTDDVPF